MAGNFFGSLANKLFHGNTGNTTGIGGAEQSNTGAPGGAGATGGAYTKQLTDGELLRAAIDALEKKTPAKNLSPAVKMCLFLRPEFEHDKLPPKLISPTEAKRIWRQLTLAGLNANANDRDPDSFLFYQGAHFDTSKNGIPKGIEDFTVMRRTDKGNDQLVLKQICEAGKDGMPIIVTHIMETGETEDGMPSFTYRVCSSDPKITPAKMDTNTLISALSKATENDRARGNCKNYLAPAEIIDPNTKVPETISVEYGAYSRQGPLPPHFEQNMLNAVIDAKTVEVRKVPEKSPSQQATPNAQQSPPNLPHVPPLQNFGAPPVPPQQNMAAAVQPFTQKEQQARDKKKNGIYAEIDSIIPAVADFIKACGFLPEATIVGDETGNQEYTIIYKGFDGSIRVEVNHDGRLQNVEFPGNANVDNATVNDKPLPRARNYPTPSTISQEELDMISKMLERIEAKYPNKYSFAS